MYRQLWLALILSTLLALIGSLLASTLSARAYLQEQLRQKNQDNATALALSLSHANVDNIEVDLAVAAMFDSGHYESIRVRDPFGKPLAEREARSEQSEVPSWFVRYFPIVAPAGEAQISDGWKQVGRVTLVSHSRFAYNALWKSTLQMIAALACAGLLGGYLGTLILRRLKRPLNTVIEQAKAITERRFITSPEPSVPELKQLSSAMNFAVARLKSMFAEEASRLESVRREANYDALTGLANRAYFMARLKSLLESDDAPAGTVMFIRVAGLADINRNLGRAVTDQLLGAVAKLVGMRAACHSDALAGRLNGADFALLLPGEEQSQAGASELLDALVAEVGTYTAGSAKIYIGLGDYAYGMNLAGVLSRIDTALADAESAGASNVRTTGSTGKHPQAHSTDQWAEMLRHAQQQRWTRLVSFPVVDFSGRLLHKECPLRLKFEAEGEWITAGQFLPMAERLDLMAELDLAAVGMGIDSLRADLNLHGLAINLSGRSIQHEQFRQRLHALLKDAQDVSHRLWLEVPENGALVHFDAFRAFCDELRGSGCKIGLEHFGRQFSQIGRFHGLAIDYLKIDASFVRDIDHHPGNQMFLKGVRSMAQSIGLQVIAEGVGSKAELETLQELGFDGVTGPAIDA
ncbi:MAG TPA: EAL domain-containing protein, partial [Noviherbaspirillum sp.]|nr:EAL domain-containing protein [Noviherbaspirillum sp.]